MRRMIVAVVAVLLFGSTVKAEEKKIVLDGNDLVVYELKEVERFPDIPDMPAELSHSLEKIYKLLKGEEENITVKGEEKFNLRFSFPIKTKTTCLDKVVTYENGGWQEKILSRTEESKDWTGTFFALIIPALGILAVSLLNQLGNIGIHKLFVFYGVLLASVFVGGVAGIFAGGLAGIFAGGFVGGLAGMSAGIFAGGLAGIFAGGLAGMFAGTSAGEYDSLYYIVFIVLVIVVSFAISFLAKEIKKRV